MKFRKSAVVLLSSGLIFAAGCGAPTEKAVSSGASSAAESVLSSSPAVQESSARAESSGSEVPTSTGRWTERASMSEPRYGFGSATINGKIYAIGGRGKTGFLSSTEVYGQDTGTWKKAEPMPTPRDGLQVTVLGGKIYAIGGSGSSETAPNGAADTAAAEQYDPVSGKWTALPSMQMGRSSHRLAVANGKIYAVGGSGDGTVLPDVEEYDPASNTWTERKPMTKARMNFGLESIDGKLYAIGGSGPLDVVSSVEMYNPGKNQWVEKAPMKTPRASFQTVVENGKIYAIGGLDAAGKLLSSVEEYDPKQDQWTAKASMNTPRSWFSAVPVHGKILVVGGWKDAGRYLPDSFLSSVEEYDFKTDRWTELTPLKTARSLFQAAETENDVLIFGGAVGSQEENESGTAATEEYTP